MSDQQTFDEQGMPNNAPPQEDEHVKTAQAELLLQEHQAANSVIQPTMWTASSFELIQRFAKAYGSSGMVPEAYRGEENIGSAIIACNMAYRLNADPLMVMQSLYVVHGKPSWSAQFLIATFNACGRFAPIRYVQEHANSDKWTMRAITKVLSSGEEITGPAVSSTLR